MAKGKGSPALSATVCERGASEILPSHPPQKSGPKAFPGAGARNHPDILARYWCERRTCELDLLDGEQVEDVMLAEPDLYVASEPCNSTFRPIRDAIGGQRARSDPPLHPLPSLCWARNGLRYHVALRSAAMSVAPVIRWIIRSGALDRVGHCPSGVAVSGFEVLPYDAISSKT